MRAENMSWVEKLRAQWTTVQFTSDEEVKITRNEYDHDIYTIELGTFRLTVIRETAGRIYDALSIQFGEEIEGEPPPEDKLELSEDKFELYCSADYPAQPEIAGYL